MRTNNGRRTERCGTPAVTNFQTEDWPLRTTCWHLFFKNDLISLKRLPSISLLLSLERRPPCQTLSNALNRSRKMSRTSSEELTSKALKMFCVMTMSWCMQEALDLNPHLLLLKRLFLLRNSKILSKISFLKILEQMGKIEFHP